MKYITAVARPGGGLVLLLIMGLACQAQIKNEAKLRHDTHLAPWGPRNFQKKSRLPELRKKYSESIREHDRAVALTRELKLNAAEAAFKKSLSFKPPSAVPYMSFIRFYKINEDQKGIQRAIQALVANPGIDNGQLFFLIDFLQKDNQEKIAILLLEQVARSKRAPEKTNMRLGQYYLERQAYKRALEFFDRVLALNPKNAQALYLSGAVYHAGGSCTRALTYLERVPAGAKLGENELPLLLADCYFRLTKLKEALAVLDKSSRTAKNPALTELKGRILLLKNWSADLRPLLRGIKSKAERQRILKAWYGEVNFKLVKTMQKEFLLEY